MNEIIFLTYILAIAGSLLIALKFGKEALVAIICAQTILANLLVTKQITLFGLTATASDALAIGSVLGLNLLQEYYGKEIAQKTIWISFFIMLFYTAITLLHIAYIPHVDDTASGHFAALLTPMPRLMLASIVTYLVSQNLDRYLYTVLKNNNYFNNYFILRNYVSTGIAQYVDTVLFSILGLWGIVTNIPDIILVSYVIKLAALILAAPFLALSKKLFTVPVYD